MMKLTVVRSVILYHYNVPVHEQVLAIFPDAEEVYIQEWADRYNLGMSAWLGHMDAGTLQRYINAAIGKYCSEADRWAAANLQAAS